MTLIGQSHQGQWLMTILIPDGVHLMIYFPV